MYIHESIAEALGMPFVILVLFFIALIALLWIVRRLDVQPSGCNQDCKQGRECDCVVEYDQSGNWPFPINRRP